MKVRKSIIVGLFAILALAGCTGSSTGDAANGANSAENDAQGTQADIYNKTQPLRLYNKSQQRATALDIQDAQATGVPTVTMFFHLGLADPYFICPSKGFPVASTTEVSNPLQVVQRRVNRPNSGNTYDYIDGVVGQMDPNGTYPGNSTGTYVLCIDSKGRTYPKYAEGFVDSTATTNASWDYVNHRAIIDGAPTFKPTILDPSETKPITVSQDAQGNVTQKP